MSKYLNDLAVICLEWVMSDLEKGYIENVEDLEADIDKACDKYTRYFMDNVRIARETNLDNVDYSIWENARNFEDLTKEIAFSKLKKICYAMIADVNDYSKLRKFYEED